MTTFVQLADREMTADHNVRFSVAARIQSKIARFSGAGPLGSTREMMLGNIWLTFGGSWDGFADTLCEHHARAAKEGFAYFPGVLRFGDAESKAALNALRTLLPEIPADATGNIDRSNANVIEMRMLVLDFDKGASFDDVMEVVRGLGLAFVAYTTHSNGKSETELLKRAAVKFNNGDNNVTDAVVQKYLSEKLGYVSEIATTATIAKEDLDDDGALWLIIKHAPIDKFRLVIPLATPFRGDSEAWKRIYCWFADKLGFPYDKSGAVMCQAFYFPSRPASSVPGRVLRGHGMPLDFAEWKDEISVAVAASSRTDKAKKSARTGIKRSSSAPSATAGNFSLRGVRIASVIAEHADDIVTTTPKSEGGRLKVSLECPFADEHTQQRGKNTRGGCWAQDPEPGKEFGVVRCSHDHCRERRTEDFIDAWITAGVLPASLFQHQPDRAVEQILREAPHKRQLAALADAFFGAKQ